MCVWNFKFLNKSKKFGFKFDFLWNTKRQKISNLFILVYSFFFLSANMADIQVG